VEFNVAILSSIKQWCSDESGATAIEYSLIAATMGLMLVPVGSSLRGLSQGLFQTLIDLFDQYQ
jgi:Flp pilus assembly pilin Flp